MTLLVSGQSSAVAIIHFPYCNWILSKYCPAVGGGVVIGQNIYILINLVFQKKGLPMAPLTLHVFLNFKGSESTYLALKQVEVMNIFNFITNFFIFEFSTPASHSEGHGLKSYPRNLLF